MIKEIDILEMEAENTHSIHLIIYHGDTWCAYGMSAIRLNKLLPNITCQEVIMLDGMVRFPRMIIDQFSLADLMEKTPPEERTEELITIRIQPSQEVETNRCSGACELSPILSEEED